MTRKSTSDVACGEMVKFSKQFEGQLVPEWKEAFVDYCKLKKELKKINLPNAKTAPVTVKSQASSLRSTLLSSVRKALVFGCPQREHGAIQVHRKLASSASNGDLYETELLEQLADSEAAVEFFACLDLQLNKVNQFYKMKEKEFLERGECLKKQMAILVELQTALSEQRADRGARGHELQEDESISYHLSCEEEQEHENVSEDSEKKEAEILGSPKSDDTEPSESAKKDDGKMRARSTRVFSFKGKNVQLRIPVINPSRTFSAITYLVKEDPAHHPWKKCSHQGYKLHINKAKLHRAEKMIRGAFVELYKGLGYLQTYRNLNMMAFVKILKKFDKVTGKQVSPIYLRVVQSSYFSSSDKVVTLSDEVEELFVKHFADEDRRKAMRYLKPHAREESHATTFFIGLFTGCLVALFVGYVTVAHITKTYKQNENSIYMETVYPVLSLFCLAFLHLFLYGCNIFMWRKARINHVFIFELMQTKDLKYRDVFLICAASMAVVVGVLFLHLSLVAKGHGTTLVHAIPGLLLLFFLAVLVCPFNVAYQSSRIRFLRVLRNILFSPFYKVVMLDFFMADQLCSQVPTLRSLEHVACYYITGSYKTQDFSYCMRTTHYRDLAYAVSFLPYYWRALQCARRWFDEGQSTHLVNLGKYVSAMLAAGAKVAYEKEKSLGWLYLVVVVSSGATVYQLYWDFVKDWGLLQPNSRNPWLRNDLMLRRKCIYYFSMALNLILRLAWLQTVLHSNFGSVDYRVTGLFLAALEIIRRGLWNFYRLENEHLNNAGKFRAVKTVPLPFRDVDEVE
uniref:Uncharacterized protein n=1 Tax=Kalanchoe fedtschenkoi TaxID=63787 RepID=A0A7N0U1M0_KALFE